MANSRRSAFVKEKLLQLNGPRLRRDRYFKPAGIDLSAYQPIMTLLDLVSHLAAQQPLESLYHNKGLDNAGVARPVAHVHRGPEVVGIVSAEG